MLTGIFEIQKNVRKFKEVKINNNQNENKGYQIKIYNVENYYLKGQ